MWDEGWDYKKKIQEKSQRRIRKILGLSVSSEDYPKTEMEKYGLGTKRTMEQFKAFSAIDPEAPYDNANETQFDNCHELQYVPYN
jgi:hypothetical protein